MRPFGLHLLLTYRCLFECQHCFVWGSPSQRGTMTLEDIDVILSQAHDLEYVDTIYFEGGEPFLYYAILVEGVQRASRMGFEVGIVSNAYWATSFLDAESWLAPFAGCVRDLSISTDLYHSKRELSDEAENALQAAEKLGIPAGTISIPQPEEDKGGLMYKGRAADQLAGDVEGRPWQSFTACPYEDFINPGRVHIDPQGYVHLCQGICVGNIFQRSLAAIFSGYDPRNNPITTPLQEGGPAGLARAHHLAPEETYADACHCCYRLREQLRTEYPDILAPDAVYGIY